MLTQECGPNWVRIHESTLNQKSELNHKIWDRGHIHIQFQSHLSDNLPICQRFGICQVQDVVMKLNLSYNFHSTIILGFCQYGWRYQKLLIIG